MLLEKKSYASLYVIIFTSIAVLSAVNIWTV